jgi:hypothetical protein
MTNDTEPTEPLEPYTAHELLSVRTITMTVSEAARLTAEHRAALNAKAEAELNAERQQLDAKLLGELASNATKRADQAHGEREAIKARLQPAALKWQGVIETLREHGVELARTTNVAQVVALVELGLLHQREAVERVAAPSFVEQATELIAKGAQPVEAVQEAMEGDSADQEAAPGGEVSPDFAPVGARVQLEHAEGYGFREFAGCYGDVVALHPSYPTLRMVQWTGDDRARPTHFRRITVVGMPGQDAEPEAAEPTA